MAFRLTLVTICFALLLATCSKSPTNPSKTQPISLKVMVKDQSNQPLPGLQVSAWNVIPNMQRAPGRRPLNAAHLNGPNTTIQFAQVDQGYFRLTVSDLDGHSIAVHEGLTAAGLHSVAFTHDSLSPGVYRAVLEIGDTAFQTVRFRDTLLMAVYPGADPFQTVVGYTDRNGVVESSDSTIFPYLYGLPQLIQTNESSPNPIGTFSYSDQAVIVVTDTAAQTSLYDTVTILPGHTTEATIEWSASAAKSNRPGMEGEKLAASVRYEAIRGDLNCDGTPYQVSDAATYVDFYMRGLPAFDSVECSILGSDVNADGENMGLDDFVYLIRVILGESQPFPKPGLGSNPIEVNIGYADTLGSCTLSNLSNDSLGTILLIVGGEVIPTLLAAGSAMEYRYENDNTRILIYPEYESVLHVYGFGHGPFLKFVGGSSLDIRSLAGATVFAEQVATVQMPTEDELFQNYPNPFN